MAKGGIPLGEWSGSDATNRLREAIKKHQQESDRQAKVVIRLTWWMTLLTVATVALALVQVWIALR